MRNPETLELKEEKGWEKVALISSDYHIPRIKALFEKALREEKDKDIKLELDYVSAEEKVKESHPGRYDDIIEQAYKTGDAQKRLKSEKRGLEDMEKGTYAEREFQLEEEK